MVRQRPSFTVSLPTGWKLLFIVLFVLPLFMAIAHLWLYLIKFWSFQVIIHDNEEIEQLYMSPIVIEEMNHIEEIMENKPDFTQSCTSNMFSCPPSPWDNKAEKLPWMRRCDGVIDCWNGFDELNCSKCLTSFSCKAADGIFLKCIPGNKLCDGKADCPDLSDESLYCHRNGTCAPGEFQCRNEPHKCFPESFRCDGDTYCKDVLFRSSFWCRECTHYSRHCSRTFVFDDKCMSVREMCDNKPDCEDHRDEQFFHCNSTDCPGSCDPSRYYEYLSDTYTSYKNNVTRFYHSLIGSFINVRCKNDKWYNTVYACSGQHPECDGMCQKCMPQAFLCPEEKSCILRERVCDGKIDCKNGEDEKNCNLILPCDDKSKQCDGICDCIAEDCIDGRNCTSCKEHKIDGGYYVSKTELSENPIFKYESTAIHCPIENKCIPMQKRCDGVEDCQSGIDEKGCECFECMIHPFEMYVCQEGERCFQKNNVCDESFLSRCPNATQMDRDYCALMKLETSGI